MRYVLSALILGALTGCDGGGPPTSARSFAQGGSQKRLEETNPEVAKAKTEQERLCRKLPTLAKRLPRVAA